MTDAVPAADPVKVTVQLPDERLQLFALRDPGPVDENVTVPVGVIAVPVFEESVTVAVHVDCWPTEMGVLQMTVMIVVRGFALTVAGLTGALPVCAWSPA